MADLINGLGGAAGFGETSLPVGVGVVSGPIDLSPIFPFGIEIDDILYDELFIHADGFVTFGAVGGASLPTTTVPTAAAWTVDHDTTGDESLVSPSPGGTSAGTDLVYLDLDPVTDTLTVTWDDVGSVPSSDDDPLDSRNAFQLQLIATGAIADVGDYTLVYRYEDVSIGQSSPPGVGISSGDGFFLAFDVFDDVNDSGFGAADVLTFEFLDDELQGAFATRDVFTTDSETPIFGNVLLDNGFGADFVQDDELGAALDVIEVGGSTGFVGSTFDVSGRFFDADAGSTVLIDDAGSVTIDTDGTFSFDPTTGDYSLAPAGASVRIDGPVYGVASTFDFSIMSSAETEIEVTSTGSDFVDLIGDSGDNLLEPTEEQGELIILGGGRDNVSGTPEALDGDTIVDFNDGDELVLLGAQVGVEDIFVEFGSLIFNIDIDGDGEPDITITLLGDYDDDTQILAAIDEALNRTTITIQRPPILDGGPASDGDDILEGSFFDDVLSALGGNDFVAGLGGDDTLFGNSDVDFMTGGDGSDLVRGAKGDDIVIGGGGDDRVSGGGGNDEVRGGRGEDRLNGGAGDDRLFGDDDDDIATGGGGDDVMFGGRGDDRMNGKAGEDVLNGGAGADSLRGGGGADRLNGQADDDTAFGGDGDDRLLGKGGADRLSGQGGEDVLIGGGGADDLLGGNGDDALRGGGGADALVGGGGDDVLDGGGGGDALRGGRGADVFIFGGGDVIEDFEDGVDEISFEGRDGVAFEELDIDAVAGGARISLGAQDVFVEDASADDFAADDFIF